jgi:peptidoglycan hydrolase-like protein with peptidoglycan-binding domain
VGVEQWFQNTRGLVIVVLAVITGAVLLAIEPGDGFPNGASNSASGGGTTVTTTATSAPPASTTTTAVSKPELQQGTTNTAETTVLQQRLNQLGYNVGTPDGNFGPATKSAVSQFQAARGISPADGVVNQATWTALLANTPASTTAPTTTTVKR